MRELMSMAFLIVGALILLVGVIIGKGIPAEQLKIFPKIPAVTRVLRKKREPDTKHEENDEDINSFYQ